MSRFKDVASVWTTIKEVDVRDIREQAEAPCRFAVVGRVTWARDNVARLLLSGADRFPARGQQLLDVLAIPLDRDGSAALTRADALLLVIDGTQSINYDDYLAYEKLTVLPTPVLVVVYGAATLPSFDASVPRSRWDESKIVYLPDGAIDDQQAILGKALLDVVPEDVHVAAARRYPGLRTATTRNLINSVSLSNASFAFTSGLPEMIPLLNLPLNAADMLVLTKNQAILAYRIALAMGAEGDFGAMVREMLPVVGGGFLWRQLARQMVGLIPGVGLLPKVAVSYAGTYVTGLAAQRWYGHKDLVDAPELKKMMKEALEDGRNRAKGLLRARKAEQKNQAEEAKPGALKRLTSRVIDVIQRDDDEPQSNNDSPSDK